MKWWLLNLLGCLALLSWSAVADARAAPSPPPDDHLTVIDTGRADPNKPALQSGGPTGVTNRDNKALPNPSLRFIRPPHSDHLFKTAPATWREIQSEHRPNVRLVRQATAETHARRDGVKESATAHPVSSQPLDASGNNSSSQGHDTRWYSTSAVAFATTLSNVIQRIPPQSRNAKPRRLAQNTFTLPDQKQSDYRHNDSGDSSPARLDEISDTASTSGESLRLASQNADNTEEPTTGDDIDLTISLAIEGDSMIVSWAFDSNDTEITGFEVSYRMNNREDFDSSRLGRQVRSFTLHSLHTDETYIICVHAIVNNTKVKDSCANWSESSMKVVIGIMAGIIFLVPCVIVLICILHKDRKIRNKYAMYDQVVEQQPLSKEPDAIHDHDGGQHKLRKSSHPNGHHSSGSDCSSTKSASKVLHDNGHDNPCTSTDDDDIDEEVHANGSRSALSNEAAPQASKESALATSTVSLNHSVRKLEPLQQPPPETAPRPDSTSGAPAKPAPHTPLPPTSALSSIPRDSIALNARQLQKDHLEQASHPDRAHLQVRHLPHKDDDTCCAQSSMSEEHGTRSTPVSTPANAAAGETATTTTLGQHLTGDTHAFQNDDEVSSGVAADALCPNVLARTKL